MATKLTCRDCSHTLGSQSSCETCLDWQVGLRALERWTGTSSVCNVHYNHCSVHTVKGVLRDARLQYPGFTFEADHSYETITVTGPADQMRAVVLGISKV